MKRFFFWVGAFLLTLGPIAGYAAQGVSSFGSTDASFAPKASNERLSEWQQYMAAQVENMRNPARRAAALATGTMPASHVFGYLNGPDGTAWTYTMDITFNAKKWYESVDVQVFDSKRELVGKFTDSFANLTDLDTTIVGVNNVELNALVTKKFFNSDNTCEVMLFYHAVTEDYSGLYYNDVFPLKKDGAEKICMIPGNQVLAHDNAVDQWAEDYVMIFQRDSVVYTETEDDYDMDYTIFFDVYTKAGWSSLPQKKHTFEVDYDFISGAGDSSVPIMMNAHNRQLCYVTARYEKPFFDPDVPWNQEPVVQPDNNLILTLFNSQFDTVATTLIPCDQQEGYLYTFPYVGGLRYNDDITFDFFAEADTAYIVSFDNYQHSTDDFQTSYYVYDLRGNRLKTIAENSDNVMWLSDVKGQEEQYCLLYETDAEATFRFVNLPSCEEVLRLPSNYHGNAISASLDRCQYGDTYRYAVSVANGDVDDEDNVYHTVAWINADGSLNRFDKVNLGKDVRLAQVNIDSRVLDPYLFNTDKDQEYMFLIKRAVEAGSSATEEVFYVVNSKGDRLLEMEPDKELGYLVQVALLDEDTKPVLSVVYYNYSTGQYTPVFVDVPFNTLSGAGTQANPYLITSAGDFRLVKNALGASYRVVADLDFLGKPFAGIDGAFRGSIDGQNHMVSNLVLNGGGLFAQLQDKAVVKDLRFYKPTLIAGGSNYNGFIANQISSAPDATEHSTVSNVMIYNPVVTGESGFDGHFGGIAGALALGSEIKQCALVDADINLSDEAVAGGIVGLVNTGSKVNACAFSGNIHAGTAAGIVGENNSAQALFANCHSNAGIVGYEAAAGIIGINNRGRVANCYAEGNVEAKGSRWRTSAGGIAGSVQAPDESATAQDTVVFNCLVGVQNLTVPETGDNVSAHRIVGASRGDQKITDWDAVGNWTDEDWEKYDNGELQYPFYYGEPDKAFVGNYVTSALAVIDKEIAAADTTVEGATLAAADLTKDFMTARQFAFGNTPDAPWVHDAAPYLWFESGVAGLLVDKESSVLLLGDSLTLTFSLLNGKGSDIKIEAETGFIELGTQKAEGENLTVTVKAIAVGTATVKATYGDLSATATVVCDKDHLRYDASTGSINVLYTSSDQVAVERDNKQSVSIFFAERANGTDRTLLHFYRHDVDADITIVPGTYDINLTQEEGTVRASEGVDGNADIIPSYYTTLENGYAAKMYFFVAGSVTVTKLADGNMKIVVDAVNSYDLPIHIEYDSTLTGLENTTASPAQDTYKFIRNGQLYIFRNGRTYTATGVVVE